MEQLRLVDLHVLLFSLRVLAEKMHCKQKYVPLEDLAAEFKLRTQEGLRNNIVSTVKQSKRINRLMGATNMKPRGLSDAIHEEYG
ncbi:hypothetical protein Tco_0878053 [Tanacetum coccineum]|uniref:Uncharacterized protein n=1 Tax=Tanacetum coccineum TaxID=301880 RepID=A0ABQ5BZZ3_9ASTR